VHLSDLKVSSSDFIDALPAGDPDESELMRMVEPLAADRWPFELALKYGMRDR
jgi:hypothetical protein